MKIVVLLLIVFTGYRSPAQTVEAQQLLLNWEKLTQFRQMLQDMYKGYHVLQKGYTNIRDISSGNFQLHKGFLDALLEVGPAVKQYKRVGDIIHYQALILKQYKRAFNQFKADGSFTLQEIEYIGKVYANLFAESLKSLNELLLVITVGELRMSDDERLQAIDRIYKQVEAQFAFLQDFNSSTSYLSLQRKQEQADVELSKRILGR